MSIGDLDQVIEPLLALSRPENVAVELSALPCLLGPEDCFETLNPHVRRVVDAFGATRCRWGSDISRLSCLWVGSMPARPVSAASASRRPAR
jgi:predicted TIM-barrel fold metal-dependent hydrolase